jgi:hypothetical protein
MVVQHDVVDAQGGMWAARATGSGKAVSAYTSLNAAYTNIYTKLRFDVISQGANSVNLVKLLRSTGGAIGGLSLSTTGKLTLRNDVAGITTTSSTIVSRGAWHTLELHAVIGSASATEVWLDGTRVGDLTTSNTLGTAGAARIRIGESSTGRTYDVAFDDVAASMAFIG